MDAASILDRLASEPQHRAVSLVLGPEVTLWIRLRRPSAAGSLLLDVAYSTISAALATKSASKADRAAALEQEADGQRALRAAANAAQTEALDAKIDRYLVETVCGTARPDPGAPDPDPEVAADWHPYTLTDRRSQVRPGCAHVRDLPPAVRRALYLVAQAWVSDPGAEVGRDVAAFRRPSGADLAAPAGDGVPHGSGDRGNLEP